MPIPDEQPPIELSAEVREYLSRMFRAAADEDRNSTKHPILYAVPGHPVVGKSYYFGAAISTTPITGEGLWVYKSTGWVQAA